MLLSALPVSTVRDVRRKVSLVGKDIRSRAFGSALDGAVVGERAF